MTNDGVVFSETDWKRIATIADGNTDTTSVGRFGVGFYCAFSYTAEPMIISGKNYMTFVWRDDNSLNTYRDELSIEEQSKTTSIILTMREKYVLRIESNLDNSKTTNDKVPTINLTKLKAYFAKVLSFTKHIMNLEIKINHLTVFQVNKRKTITPPTQDKWVFRPQPSINNMLLLDSFSVTEQILTIDNGPSITLSHVAVDARLNIDQQFHNHVRRILNKSLPNIVQIQLLFVPIDVIIDQQKLQSSATNDDLNTQILNSILPIKFIDNEIVPAGFIFIGLGTHQSTGIGMHVSSHLIQTVEREDLDLQDPYIGKWNEELLASIGQIARCIYDQMMIDSSHSIAREHYDAVMAPYSFQTTVPEKEIGVILLNGFFASRHRILVPVQRLPSDPNLSLVSSTEAFLADSKHIQSFLSIPLVPFELTKNRFFIALKERQLITHLYKATITNQLTSTILTSIQLIGLLNWVCSDDVNDNQYTKRLLSNIRFRETANSSIISFGQLDSYDASHISSVLPLPVKVLTMSIARHFSQDQLQNKLFLLPCAFKDLIDSYLHKTQHYLLHDPKTAACLLSNFSKHSNQLSESQWTRIKSVLSTNQCIPTTQGMKLPNESYIPSSILKADLPTITLNLVSHKAKKNTNSEDNLVSIEFLKQIGCRMLHIPSIIDDHCRISGNRQAFSTKILIESLIEERKNMTDADFNALKQSKFLRGTTRDSTEETGQNYLPGDLHFPMVAAQLNWSDLLIIDWEDIDIHSSAYAFLKELGVREVPALHNLINRIVNEHKHIESQMKRKKTKYELPISLRFFAENFQKHYSVLWHTSDIQQAFLPSYLSTKNSNTKIILSAPDKVFTDPNPLCAILEPEVVILFKRYLNISLIGIKAQPTLTQAFDILMERKKELLTYEWACEMFAYLNKLDGLNHQLTERLFKIDFIPLQGAVRLMKPSEVFIRSNVQQRTTRSSQNPKLSTVEDIDMSGLIDYVDFGPLANSFLVSIGVRDYPSPSMLAELLIDRQENYFANSSGDSETFKGKLRAYMECLKQLAGAASRTSDLQNGPIQRRLQNEPWCLGICRSINHENDDSKKDYRILRPTEVFLNDDDQCAQNLNPWCPPDELTVIKLYEQFGTKWLSDCVSRQLKHKGKSRIIL